MLYMPTIGYSGPSMLTLLNVLLPPLPHFLTLAPTLSRSLFPLISHSLTLCSLSLYPPLYLSPPLSAPSTPLLLSLFLCLFIPFCLPPSLHLSLSVSPTFWVSRSLSLSPYLAQRPKGPRLQIQRALSPKLPISGLRGQGLQFRVWGSAFRVQI